MCKNLYLRLALFKVLNYMKQFLIFIFLFVSAYLALSLSFKSKTDKKFVDNRDGQVYKTTIIGNLKWMMNNLRYETENSLNPSDFRKVDKDCGIFYSFEESKKVCPRGWRLPTHMELRHLIHLDSIKKINLTKELDISFCGNSDRGALTRIGFEAAFWVDAAMREEQVDHWHTYPEGNVVHSHNVNQVDRKYPVRCVCEIEN